MADLDGLALKPWQQQPGETNTAFHAFTHFLALLPYERSMDRAYSAHQYLCKGKVHPSGNNQKNLSCSPQWQDYRFRHGWLERVALHDRDIAEVERLRRVHEIQQMNHRHTQIAVALQNIVVERLHAAVAKGESFTLTPTQMATLLDKAALVERRSRGEATSIVKHQGSMDEAMALDLSKLSEQELEVFQSLVAKAEPGAPVEED